MRTKAITSLTAMLTLSTFIGTALIPAALASEGDNNIVTPANIPVVTTDESGISLVNDSPAIMNKQGIISQACPTADILGNPATYEVPRVIENDGRSYELVWNDEFCGNKLDRTRWRPSQEPENGRMHYVNVEGEESDPESTVWVKDGAIHLRANHDEHEYETKRIDPKTGEKIKRTVPVKSTNLNTQGLSAWKYGRFEVRLKTTAQPGTWPAFWLMPQRSAAGWPRDGEIDWFENIGDSPNSNFTSVHSSTLPHFSIRSRDDSAKSAAVNLENGKYQGGGATFR